MRWSDGIPRLWADAAGRDVNGRRLSVDLTTCAIEECTFAARQALSMPKSQAEAAAAALVLEESVDEDGRRERRVANLDNVEDARAVAEQSEAEAMERELWGAEQGSVDRPRGLGGGAEWPRMPGMAPINSSPGPRRSPRRRSQQQQRQRVEPVDLFGDSLQSTKGVLRPNEAKITKQRASTHKPDALRKRKRSSPTAKQEVAEAEEAEEELDTVDKRNLKRIVAEQLRSKRTDLCTLTPARLRRKCASAMAFPPDRLDGPQAARLVDQWIKDELLRDPAGYLRRAGRQ